MSLPIINGRTDDDRRQHPYCQECKLDCASKGKDWDQTTKNCHGIYSEADFIELSQSTQGTPVQITVDEVRELLDPSFWIWKHLGLTPFWYQDRYLRCTSTRKALRWGRRTGKSHILAAEQLYRCISNNGLKIVVAASAKAQVLEIFNRIGEFLRENPEIGAEVERSVQQPYYALEFKNGSRIRLFVLGSSGGANAGSQVRGQEADVLIIDEMDYVDDGASAAIMPLLSDPHRTGEAIKFAVSSTPTGRESTFYHLCSDDNFKEMHIPARFREDWDTQKEEEARANSKTSDNYTHEYDADWGSKTDGVYPRSRVIRAMQPYRYYGTRADYENEQEWPEMVPWAHWTYMLGVDWNGAGNGSRIAIVGFDPEREKWIVVYREVITVEQFALHVAVERVVQLNRLWRPHSVYIDAGFGQMQDEYLRGIGRAAENAKATGQKYEPADIILVDHLKAIDFGSNIEYTIKDENGALQKMTKPKKNYMVENFQHHFELDSFWFSRADASLKSQLMGYAVARQDKHNRNIYKADSEAGDHDHDAVLLALFGFNQEFDPFFAKNRSAQYVEVGPRPFQKPEAESMPDPMSDPRAYDEWLEARKKRGGKAAALRSPTEVPSRGIKPQAPQQLNIGISVMNVPTAPSAGRGLSYRPPSQGRNSWQKRGNNGRGI